MSPAEQLHRMLGRMGRGQVLENYILPGLRSVLLATHHDGGKTRVFEMEREQEAYVTAHDHRYSFSCCVLSGRVVNRLYSVREALHKDMASHALLPYSQASHSLDGERARWVVADYSDQAYVEGDWYGMKADQFHSITFSKGARVLFLEGREEKKESWCLLPYSAGRICSTFAWHDWMMKETT